MLVVIDSYSLVNEGLQIEFSSNGALVAQMKVTHMFLG